MRAAVAGVCERARVRSCEDPSVMPIIVCE